MNTCEAAVYNTQILKGFYIVIKTMLTFRRVFLVFSIRGLILSCVFFFFFSWLFPPHERLSFHVEIEQSCHFSLAEITRTDKIDDGQSFAFPKILFNTTE